MWFKNIRLYQPTQAIAYDADSLALRLAAKPFAPCPKVSPHSVGWAAPIDLSNSDPSAIPHSTLVHAANGYLLICLQMEERLLPPAVLRQSLQSKIADIEQQQGRKIGRREKLSMQDELYFSLLPRAFTQQTQIYACIDTRNQRVWLDTGNKKQAELFLDCWHNTVSDIKLTQQSLTPSPKQLTRWIKNAKLPDHFDTTDSMILRQARNIKTVIRCQQQDIFANPIQQFLKDDYEAVQLALTWADKVSFTLKEEGILGSLRFLEEVKELSLETTAETAAQRFDADFLIMTDTLTPLIDALLVYNQKEHTASLKKESSLEPAA
jgi:recombination associated protein RdgC